MQCLNGTLLPNNTDRGLLLLQLGRHLQDLGQTSLAVQVGLSFDLLSSVCVVMIFFTIITSLCVINIITCRHIA